MRRPTLTTYIEELANQANSDLVLMNTHGHSGQFTHPYGNLTRNYMEQGSKAILVILDVARSKFSRTVAAAAVEESRGGTKRSENRSKLAYVQIETLPPHYHPKDSSHTGSDSLP